MLSSNTLSHYGFRSFVPLCSARMFSGSSHSHWKHIDGASTLPRTKPKTYRSPACSAKPSISIPPAQKPDCPPTLSARRPKPSDSLHLPASEPTDPPPPLDPNLLCVSSTLPVPTIRLSPSSMCQDTNLDGSQTRQPSPVARERRARSISILATNIQPVSSKERSGNEERRDVLESVTDVTHSSLRGDCSVTYTESHRRAAESQNSFVLNQEVDLIKDKYSNADESKTAPRKIGVPVIRPLNLNSKRQLEFPSNATTGAARPVHWDVNLHRKHKTAQTVAFGSKEPLQEHLAAGRHADLPAAPLDLDSTEVFWNQSTIVPKQKQFNFNILGNTDAALPSVSNLSRPFDENIQVTAGLSPGTYQQTSAAHNKTPPQKHRLRENTNTQMNAGSTLKLSSGTIEDYCFRPKSEACQGLCLSESKLHLQCPDQQQVVFPAKCSTSHTECSTFAITPCNQKLHPGQNKSHAAVNLSDTGLNQSAEGPAKLPECSPQSWVGNWPLSVEHRSHNPNGPGNKSNGVFDFLAQPQRRVYQRAADTTPMAWPSLNQPNYRQPDRAIFLEEDPYYVTMYHPGSVYVGE